MSNANRMRWRPAFGVMALGVIAIGFGIQGASAEKARTAKNSSAQSPPPAVVGTPGAVNSKAAARKSGAVQTTQAATQPKSSLPAGAEYVPNVVDGEVQPLNWVNPEEEVQGFTGIQAEVGLASSFQNADAEGVVAVGTTGACCVAPATCLNNQTQAQCDAVTGTLFLKESCLTDPCGFLLRACCSPSGMCLMPDRTRTDCESAGNTWHIEASCTGAGGLPTPKCNPYDVNNCVWDNGLPLNDGGASRSHTHSAGAGQLPRYDFSTADDFILAGPDSTPCEVNSIRWYVNPRPSDTAGPVFVPANPPIDFIGINVTVYENFIDPKTGLNSPAGYGLVPFDGNDLNPKVPEPGEPGGIVYARTYCTGTAAAAVGICPGPVGLINFNGTFLPGFCDPPPVQASEVGHIWQVDITVDPPLLLNKNKKYWLEVQALMPFNDGLRETLQSWWAVSQNNTGFRGMTHRTANAAYIVNGQDVWRPTAVAPSPQGGNQGAPAPCAGVPLNTRLDYAFRINGAKDAPAIPNDLCVNATEVFDGTTAFDNTGAGDDLPVAGCGASGQDIWFEYTATCTGVLTVTTCGSDFDSLVEVYELGCPASMPLDCGNDECDTDDATANPVVINNTPYLIRVAGVGASEGKGNLTIGCDRVCGIDDGDPLVNNCCINHAGLMPPDNLGCEIETCCEVVCALAGEAGCCADLTQGWDNECATVAGELEVCQCPCLFTPTCSAGNYNQIETEACGANTNGGCNNFPSPETFEGPIDLVKNVQRSACGTVQAAGNSRDTDWWIVNVPDMVPDVATLTVILNGEAPVGLLIFGRLNPPTNGTFCTDSSVCTDVTDCFAGTPCTMDSDCPTGETCILDVGATLLAFDSIGTASCQPTDGTSDCEALVTCVPAPGQYVFVIVPTASDNDCNITDGIFNNLACGARDNYSFRVTATNDCTDGACCTFGGGCTDGTPPPSLNEYECFVAGGNFAGEGTTCEALPPDVDCLDLTHGCVAAQTITCGSTTSVNLVTDDHLPEEPYPCGADGNDPNDRWWGKFVMTCNDDDMNPGANDCNDQAGPDIASARLDTCTSVNPGRDSLLGIYGVCCPPSGICPSGAECDPDLDVCGGGCSAAEDFSVAGCSDDVCGFTDFLSDICAERLIEGETYYVQLSNWAEPVNGIYQVRLSCPCAGSCCHEDTGVCDDGVAADTCQDLNESFSTQFTCATLPIECGLGACCAPDGTCTNSTLPDCPAGSNHNPGAACSSIVCNLNNTCNYNTGDPTNDLDLGTFGFRSQYAADINLFVEVADQFTMKGDTNNDCEINSILYTTFHTSHDTDNGCDIGGGGPGCVDSPSEYEGIIVTISADSADLTTKGPACEPNCTSTTCSGGPAFHTENEPGGCLHSVAFGPALAKGDPIPPGNYWEFEVEIVAQAQYYITLTFQPKLVIPKNKKLWLAITHVLDEVSRYSVIWFASNNYNGNPSQIYNSLGAQTFLSLEAFPNDQIFQINGKKQTVGCSQCQLFGDVVDVSFNPVPDCLVDVSDLVCILQDFQDITFCVGDGDIINADFATCGPDGLVDSTDIIAVLTFFSTGFSPCPNPCNPGACNLATPLCSSNNAACSPVGSSCDGGLGTCDGCRDGSIAFPGGMSQGQCNVLGGTYCGDCKFCGDLPCDGACVCTDPTPGDPPNEGCPP